jgi:hypothetical protein
LTLHPKDLLIAVVIAVVVAVVETLVAVVVAVVALVDREVAVVASVAVVVDVVALVTVVAVVALVDREVAVVDFLPSPKELRPLSELIYLVSNDFLIYFNKFMLSQFFLTRKTRFLTILPIYWRQVY